VPGFFSFLMLWGLWQGVGVVVGLVSYRSGWMVGELAYPGDPVGIGLVPTKL